MKKSLPAVFLLPIVLLILSTCTSDIENSDRTVKYLGQKPPEETPEIFAPGIVSTDLDEYGCTFSPDGKEFYFTRTFENPNRHTIMICKLIDGEWSSPEIASFSGEFPEGEPNFSHDGQKIFWGRLIEDKDGSFMPYIHVSIRKQNGWSEPEKLMHGMFVSITKDGTLYTTDVMNGMDKAKLVRSKIINGKYEEPELLPDNVNSLYKDAHPFVDPDEEYIIFDSTRPGGFGETDLYITFKLKDGNWSNAVNLGEVINSSDYNAIPYVSPDKKYLFFYKEHDIYWIKADFIEELKPAESK